jgi:two-component system, NarL family, sensor histidine kinase UhpB
MLNRLSPSLRLPVLYLIVSAFWIMLSDQIANKLARNDYYWLDEAQHVKGILFVLLTALLLYFTCRKLYRSLHLASLKKNEALEKYKALAAATKECIIEYDLINDVAHVNDVMKQFMNKSTNTIESFSAAHVLRIHPEDAYRVTRNFEETLASASNFWQADFRYLARDQSYRDVIMRGYFIRDQHQTPEFAMLSMQDVTEIKNVKAIFYEQQIQHKLALAQSIIKAQELERNRWAEELHDDVCQVLTVAKLFLEQLPADHSELQIKERSLTMIRQALNEIRQLSATIKPPEFSYTTLKDAIAELASNINRVRKYRFRIDLQEELEHSLDDEQKLMIYRVVQEQLSNIIKYAQAESVAITVRMLDSKVLIAVSDDGQGFDPATIQSGIGLRNIRSRLQVYSGNLTIESAPGKGCIINAFFCLN